MTISLLPNLWRSRRSNRATEHLAPCQSWELPLHIGKRAFNPSLVRWRGRILMAYNFADGWACHQVGLSQLDDDLNVVGDRLLDLTARSVARTEDMRLFVHDDRLHGLYFEGRTGHADAGLVLLQFDENLNVSRCETPRYGSRPRGQEKNWQFFSHDSQLLCIYSISPHLILKQTGQGMRPAACTETDIRWRWGEPRGGTPPIEFEGEYLCFFQSHTRWPHKSACWPHRIYHVGAYTFDKTPPFRIRRVTAEPLMSSPTFDTDPRWPAVCFPCGAISWHGKIVVSYGYHDQRPRLAVYEPAVLGKLLKPI